MADKKVIGIVLLILSALLSAVKVLSEAELSYHTTE